MCSLWMQGPLSPGYTHRGFPGHWLTLTQMDTHEQTAERGGKLIFLITAVVNCVGHQCFQLKESVLEIRLHGSQHISSLSIWFLIEQRAFFLQS